MSIQSITEVRAQHPAPTLTASDMLLLDQTLRTVAATLAEIRAFVRPNVATGSEDGLFTSSEKTKLSGIAAGATANQTDSYLLNRANHSGTQAISTVVGLVDALALKLESGAPIASIAGLADALGEIEDALDDLSGAIATRLPTANPAPTGAIRFPRYTLADLPDASALNEYSIVVTDAAGGPTLCHSDGVVWKIDGTTDTVV